MKLAGRLSAAIDVLTEIEQNHAPAKTALGNWGRSNRFAGSKDRAAIGNLVYDVLRNKLSLAFQMEDETPRALTLAAAISIWGEDAGTLETELATDKFSPGPMTEAEKKALTTLREETPPDHIAANIPAWLCEPLSAAFGDDFINQAKALSERAPIDIRTNSLKATPEKLQKALAKFGAAPVKFAPLGLRLPPATAAVKAPNIEAEAAHGKGWFEIQDEGSQIACQMTGAKPGDQILDYCAGAGGKTLALSAQMDNKGQIHAYDNDKHRLRPIFERLKRAGCRNVQTVDAGDEAQLAPLAQTMDIVLVDAPCTGTGTWRRHPDARWRLSEAALETRLEEQRTVLAAAQNYVRPGGRLVYVTCSLLPAENQQQMDWFTQEFPAFKPVPYKSLWQPQDGTALTSAISNETNLTLTPATHGTDGFFIALLERA